jgi:hypothetical protein
MLVAAGSALVVALLAPAMAAAQTAAPRAQDGKNLDDESAATRALFQAAYGAEAATRWQREHNIAVRTDLPRAADGLTLQSQPNDVRAAFIGGYGSQAGSRWAIVHSGAIGRAIILSDDLEEAVEAAHKGDLAGAQSDFKQFSTAWENDFETLIRPRSADIANAVATQIRAVARVLITPANPDRAAAAQELDELLEIVKEQQQTLAALPAGAPVVVAPPLVAAPPATAAPPAAAASAAAEAAPKLSLVIDTDELEQSIRATEQNNLVKARGDFDEFVQAWQDISGRVRNESAAAYSEINAAVSDARALLGDASRSSQAANLAALQKVQTAVKKYQ